MKRVKQEIEKIPYWQVLAIALLLIVAYGIYSITQCNCWNDNKIKAEEDQAKLVLADQLKTYQALIQSDYNQNKLDQDVVYHLQDGKITRTVGGTVSLRGAKNVVETGNMILKKDGSFALSIQAGQLCAKKDFEESETTIAVGTCTAIDYVKKASEMIEFQATSDELKDDTLATGLDATKAFSSKKYFVGVNPNNYFVSGGSCYRIMSIAQNDTLKIIYEGKMNANDHCGKVASDISGYVGLLSWDEDRKKISNWNDATLNEKMKNWSEEGRMDLKNVVVLLRDDEFVDADWYIGEVKTTNETLQQDIQDERSLIATNKNKVGLINNSDYLKVSCQKASGKPDDNCSKNNYLYKPNYNWWTINAITSEGKQAWVVLLEGRMDHISVAYSKEFNYSGVRPVSYLDSKLKLKGSGMPTDPYRIAN